MQKTKKFISFLESMKVHNPSLVEAVKTGFKACFEGIYPDGMDGEDHDVDESGEVMAEKMIGRDITISNEYFDKRYNNQQNIVVDKATYDPETDSILISGEMIRNDDISSSQGSVTLTMEEAREVEMYGNRRSYIDRQETP